MPTVKHDSMFVNEVASAGYGVRTHSGTIGISSFSPSKRLESQLRKRARGIDIHDSMSLAPESYSLCTTSSIIFVPGDTQAHRSETETIE